MNTKLNYVLSCSGKNHYFDIAKVLYDRKQLTKIVCGYPWFKLKKYGINKEFVSSNGFIRIIREPLISSKFHKKLDNFLNSLNSKNIDRIACNFINKNTHLLLESAHPSPFSANNGFFGSKPFSKTNNYLMQKNIEPIDWQL